MPVPMTRIYEDEGSTMFGIAKYPVDRWMAAGQPMITTKGWIKLCSKIAAKDLGHLSKALALCQHLESRL
eukprot:509090-Prorocentrum_lima.AAC.1